MIDFSSSRPYQLSARRKKKPQTTKKIQKALRAFVDKTKLTGGFSSPEWKARQTHVPIIQSAFEHTHARTHAHTHTHTRTHA